MCRRVPEVNADVLVSTASDGPVAFSCECWQLAVSMKQAHSELCEHCRCRFEARRAPREPRERTGLRRRDSRSRDQGRAASTSRTGESAFRVQGEKCPKNTGTDLYVTREVWLCNFVVVSEPCRKYKETLKCNLSACGLVKQALARNECVYFSDGRGVCVDSHGRVFLFAERDR